MIWTICLLQAGNGRRSGPARAPFQGAGLKTWTLLLAVSATYTLGFFKVVIFVAFSSRTKNEGLFEFQILTICQGPCAEYKNKQDE